MRKKLLSILALLFMTISSAWADWDGGTYTATGNETITGSISVNADATLTINSGATVTVNGGIVVADGKTLTITGGGTLVVNGSNGGNGSDGGNGDYYNNGGNGGTGGNGDDAIQGNVIINGVTVEVTGGDGGKGGDGGDDDKIAGNGGEGGTGGNAFSGAVTIISGTVTATGGAGGNGGWGGDSDEGYSSNDGGNGGGGGSGGNAFSSVVTIISGTITATGGTGGSGGGYGYGGEEYPGSGGYGGYAFYSSLTVYGGLVTATGGAGGNGSDSSFDRPPSNAFFANDVTFKAASYTMEGGDSANPSVEVTNATGYRYVTITSTDADFVVASGSCGTSVTWSLNILGEMTISGTGAMADYSTSSLAPWNGYNTSINCVVIESGVTSIGRYAFPSCTNLTSVTIPISVASIANQAFQDCTSLATVSFGNGLTTIGIHAFSNCTSLTSANLPASVTYIGGSAFYNCTNLATVTLNSNPYIGQNAFPDGATVTMNLTAHEGEIGEYWMTFYNRYYNFQVPATGTQIFKAAISGTALTLTELTTDQIVTKNNAVILKSTASTIVMTLVSSDGSNNFTGNSLEGVTSGAGMTAADPSTTFVLNNGTQGIGFYKLTSGKKLGVGKAYLTYTGSFSSRGFIGFDDTTGIGMPTAADTSDANAAVYDLQGRRVTDPAKGLYIINGKKVLYK